MRITKRIEDYILQQVTNRAHQSPEYIQSKKEADKELQAFNEELEVLKTRVRNELNNMAEAYGIEGNEPLSFQIYGSYRVPLPAVLAHEKMDRELFNKIRNKVQDIIITMEMGGTKDQLQELLDEVSF